MRAEDREWRHQPDLLSFVDVLLHLVDADRWLFDVLDGKTTSNGVIISPGGGSSSEWDYLFDKFRQLGVERRDRITAVQASDLFEKRFDLGARGEFTMVQLILRCNLDHEIHHRGALQLALRLRYRLSV